MLPVVSNVPTSSTATESTRLTHKNMNVSEVQDCHLRHLSDSDVVNRSDSEVRLIGDLDVEVAGASEAVMSNVKAKKSVACLSCHKEFPSMSRLNKHMLIHDPRYHYQCKMCNKGFKRKFDYEKHYNKMHTTKIKSYQCDQCTESYMYLGDLNRHKIIKHEAGLEYKCKTCDKKFRNKSNFKRHCTTVHKLVNESYKFDECNQGFTNLPVLNQHKTQCHDKDNRYKCGICNKCFTQKCSLDKHKITHKTIMKLHDAKYEAQSHSGSDLTKRRKEHSKDKSLRHEKCHGPYQTKTDRKHDQSAHIDDSDSAASQPHHATVGQPSTSSTHVDTSRDLRTRKEQPDLSGMIDDLPDPPPDAGLELPNVAHRNTDLSAEQYGQVQYPPDDTVAAHNHIEARVINNSGVAAADVSETVMANAEGEKYRCDLCDEEFLSKSDRNQHQTRHGKKQYHICAICNEDFEYSSVLKLHYKINHHITDGKPYICDGDNCHQAFATLSSLNKHKSKHSEKRNYQCKICNSSFKRKSSLLRHIQTVHRSTVSPHRNKQLSARDDSRKHLTTYSKDKSYQRKKCHNLYGVKNNFTHRQKMPHTTIDQPSTSSTHVDKLRNQETCKDPFDSSGLLDDFPDIPVDISFNKSNNSCNSFLSVPDIPEQTSLEQQIPVDDSPTSQLYSITDQPLTRNPHTDESQDQEEYAQLLDDTTTLFPTELFEELNDHYDNFLCEDM